MPFTKLVKNKAYFSRYQTKYRRRREGKTDFRARRTMVQQSKTKYGAPKYRLVVRVTNRDISAQFISAEVVGDKTLAAAYAHELPAFGLNHGLTNYAAAYATGLLLARRTLTKLKIADKFAAVKEATGEYSEPVDKADFDKEKQGRFPFRAILDVGLARTTTGARIFGAMKGVVDGGVLVPHRPNRFPGFKKGKFDAKVLRDRIFGAHVGAYMQKIADKKKANPDFKTSMFSKFGTVKAADLEKLYKSVHEAIKKDPTKRIAKKGGEKNRKNYSKKALTHPERRKAVEKKIAALRKKLKA